MSLVSRFAMTGRRLPGRRGCARGRAVRVPCRWRNPDLLAKLGSAADRALAAVTPTDLMEICRMRSPSGTAKRLALALAVTLGLR